MRYAFLTFIWLGWCFCHSALISMRVTRYLKHHLAERFRYYRLAYNGFSLITLIPIVLYSDNLRGDPLFSWEGYWRAVQVLLLATSLFLFVAGGRHHDTLSFLGLRQLRSGSSCAGLNETCDLNTKGILGIMRHPWYSGGIMIIWARELDLSVVVTNVILTGYFIVGAFLEERKLLVEFPETYKEYQKKVSMFFPYRWLILKWKR